jgi:tetratricopeptide (TPR) repeat protein
MRVADLTRCVLLLLLFWMPIGAGAQDKPQDQLQTVYREGAQAMTAGNPSAAEAAFRKATEIAPDFAPAFLDLGLTQLRQGKLPEAIASIRRSLQLDPHSSSAHLFLGIAEYQSSHAEEAIAALQQAIQEDAKNEQAQSWLGIVELNTGHPENATGPLDRAAELAPTDQTVLDYRVQAHMAVAKQSYSQLYQLDPGSWRLHRLNAVIDAQATDHKQAVEEYKLAIKLAPKEPELYEGLGWEYWALGQTAQAAQSFAEQLKLTPESPIAMYNLGSAEAETGQAEAAIPLLERVTKIYVRPTGADYYLGRALASQNRNAEAAREFERATTLTGEMQRRAWYELSQVYRHLGEPAKAHAAVLKFQELKQQADRESARQVEDWRKLNAANATASGGTR